MLFFLSFFFTRGRGRKKKPGAGFLFIRRRKLEEGESSAGMIRVNKDKSNSGGTGEEREIKCSLTSDSRKRTFLFFKAKHAPRRIPAETNRGKPRLYPRILNFIKEPFLPIPIFLRLEWPRFRWPCSLSLSLCWYYFFILLNPSKQVYTI